MTIVLNVSMSEFLRYIDDANDAFNRSSADVNDICSNITSIVNNAFTGESSVSAKFGQLQRIQMSGFPDIMSSRYCEQIALFSEAYKGVKVMTTLNYYKDQIDIYNKTGMCESFTDYWDKLSEEDKIELLSQYEIELGNTNYDATKFIILNDFATAFNISDSQMLKIAVSHGIDSGLSALVRKSVIKISESAVQSGNYPLYWFCQGAGTFLACGLKALDDYFSDEGVFTNDDWLRLGLDTFNTGLTFAEWSLVYGSLCASSVPGAGLIAGGIVMVSGMVLGSIKDLIVGDNTIDTVTVFGQEYKIPANGTGKNGTWDVMYERCKSKLYNGYIDGVPYSGSNYIKRFDNWEELLQDERDMDIYSPLLNGLMDYAMEHYDTAEEAANAIMYGEYEDGVLQQILADNGIEYQIMPYNYAGISNIVYRLETEYGFDLKNYLIYRYGSGKK